MIAVNLQNGRTLRFDLEAPADAELWEVFEKEPHTQRTITGVAVLHDGKTHALPLPKNFRKVTFRAELVRTPEKVIGEKVSCQADEVEATLMVYRNGSPPMVRCDLSKLGKQRFVR